MTLTPNGTLWLTFASIELTFLLGMVLNGIDLTMRQGEVVTLLGPSGLGKSTVLRCINVLEDTDDGLIQVGGELIGVELERDRVIRRRDMDTRRQRAGIGMRPSLLLCDEPTSALDPELVGEVLDAPTQERTWAFLSRML